MFNFYGIITAVLSILIIGVFHPIIVKCEYYFSEKIWPLFLVFGLAFCAASVFTKGIVSVCFALVGAASFWSIHELKEQTKRVERGWFPKNENRKNKKESDVDK